MKDAEIIVLDEAESSLVQMLENFGLSQSRARVTVCLTVRANSTIKEIAASTRLSTAAVSIALKKLREDGLVSGSPLLDRSNNRMITRYNLTGNMGHILSVLENKTLREVSGYMKKTGLARERLASKYYSHS